MRKPLVDMSRECLSEEVIAAFIDRRLTRKERQSAVDHLAGCEDCCSLLAETCANDRGWRRGQTDSCSCWFVDPLEEGGLPRGGSCHRRGLMLAVGTPLMKGSGHRSWPRWSRLLVTFDHLRQG